MEREERKNRNTCPKVRISQILRVTNCAPRFDEIKSVAELHRLEPDAPVEAECLDVVRFDMKSEALHTVLDKARGQGLGVSEGIVDGLKG